MSGSHCLVGALLSFATICALHAQSTPGPSPIVPGSIVVSECRGCEDILELPRVEYAKYVGFGPHIFEGFVGIDITIDEKGSVTSTRAIFGHPFFRLMLEKVSLTAKFKPPDRMDCDVRSSKKAILFYKIVPPIYSKAAEKQLGIVNGRATILPKPEFTQQHRDLCANGAVVEIAVLIGEDGSVIEAKAISGDELLYHPALAAAKRAKFRPVADAPPVRFRGKIVYRFSAEKTCLDVGNVNGKWIKRPSFSIDPHAIVRKTVDIKIRVGIDIHSGRVIAARALNGHPLIRASLEKQSLKIKFHPTLIDSPPMIAKGLITVRILRDRTVKL